MFAFKGMLILTFWITRTCIYFK